MVIFVSAKTWLAKLEPVMLACNINKPGSPSASKKGAVRDQSTVLLLMLCSHYNKFMFHVHDYLIFISFFGHFSTHQSLDIFFF